VALQAQAGAPSAGVISKAAALVGINLPGSSVAQGVAWAPVKSTITVTVQPLYSREQVRNFSLDRFIKGDYVLGSGNNKSGFI
jgi:hypothetical protein